jgi:GT2 family glycosyltransferase
LTSATVIIVSRERRMELRRALESALIQTAEPEVIVIDDASTDGTCEMVRAEFPRVRLYSTESAIGYIRQRNRGAELSGGEILFSIDDDATFSSAEVVEATLNQFDDPRVGAVAIPCVDINRGPEVRQQAPNQDRIYLIDSFIGTAHALRRDLFTRLRGYRTELCHQGEEEDYCIRMLDAGFVTRCGNSAPIHHFESPRRNWARMDYYGARNKILFAWHNVPFPEVSGHLAATTLKTLLHALRPDRFWIRFRGVIAAYALCASGRARRSPVARSTYHLSRRLKMKGPLPLDQISTPLAQYNHLKWPSCASG